MAEEKKHSTYLRVTIVSSDPKRPDEIVEQLRDHVKKFGYCSFNMLFHLVNGGLGPDNIVGWDDLEKVLVNSNNHGASVVLPICKEIDFTEKILPMTFDEVNPEEDFEEAMKSD